MGRGGIVRIRLAREGRIHNPVYRIRVADAKCPRNGKYLEEVGSYFPVAESRGEREDRQKVLKLDRERIKYWLSVGAQPSEPVARLLSIAKLLPPLPRRASGFQGVKKADRGFATYNGPARGGGVGLASAL